ncbi:TetR/AcrR family transcriptional regulator [Sphingomonas sp. BK580]|uniref:TetR/AcrR family transcriptional regulator n=1 Tax=Sphingomonas sp. BK580 TaxID=2586972 RepID=UPI00160B4F7C|nr:TetR/AcrR family transcriptional regulator [Sphingomonas sp. BK580]MBB3691971.1 AcrR family transcriptional regulator [Sphingomonas sp. BK580]
MTQAGTRRSQSREARRAAIVAVARQAFLENGYAATSMSTIASELGGSKGTLWAYFPSKEELFAAVLDDVTATFRMHLEDALRPGRDCRTTLVDFAQRFLGKMTNADTLRLSRLIIGEGGRFPEVGRLFYESGPRRVLERLSAYLAECVAAGQLRACDTTDAAVVLVQLIQSQQTFVLWGIKAPMRGAEARAFCEEIISIFFRAFAPAGASVAE